MKKRTWILTYINSRYNEVTKTFDNMEDALNMVAILDKRLENKTCFGYILSDI